MPSQAFNAHTNTVAEDLGVPGDEVRAALKEFAQKKVQDALNLYSDGVKESYINSKPIPVADLIATRLGYMALFD